MECKLLKNSSFFNLYSSALIFYMTDSFNYMGSNIYGCKLLYNNETRKSAISVVIVNTGFLYPNCLKNISLKHQYVILLEIQNLKIKLCIH